MLDCTITGMSQDLDFASNATVTYLSIRLPDGSGLRIAVDEAVAEHIIKLQVAAKGAPSAPVQGAHVVTETAVVLPRSVPATPPPEEADLPETDDVPGPGAVTPVGESVFVFGGQDEDPDLAKAECEEAQNSSPTVISKEPPPQQGKKPRSRIQKLPNGKVVVPSRTVPALDRGYPDTPNGMNTDDFTGSVGRDEDGVGSV